MSSSSSVATPLLTVTQRQQKELEEKVKAILESFAPVSHQHHSWLLELWRDEHTDYLLRGLEHLGSSFCVLDANRPWLCYWILHSLALLGEPIDAELGRHSIDFLARCQDSEGGYGGGPTQMAHLATTYAAVFALVTIGGNEALASINRGKTLQFLLRMKHPSGAFSVHDNGEMDVRGCYTAIAVGHILDILVPALTEKVADYIVSCQTHEGGIGGEPGAEAHGGYTYCGLAALALINQAHMLDLPRLVNWAVFRQGKVEGGFQGRTNKLVDGCYSFWQGGIFPLVQRLAQRLMCQQAAAYSSVENLQKINHTVSNSPKKMQAETSNKGVKMAGLSTVESHFATQPKINDEDIAETNDGVVLDASNRVDSVHVNRTDVGESTSKTTAENLFPSISDLHWRLPIIQSCEDCETGRGKHCVDSNPVGDASIDVDICEISPACTLFNSQALQSYLLLCSQVFEGGFRDKPGKHRDYYHTCYCLSGLSTAQYCYSLRSGAPPPPHTVLGPFSNLVEPIHPLCNVILDRYYDARKYFRNCYVH